MAKIWRYQGQTENTKPTVLDQAFGKKYFKNKISKGEIDSKCQSCKQREETVENLKSGCPILAKRRHRFCAHLRYSVHKALGIEATDKYQTHARTHKHEDVVVLWNRRVHTDSEVMQIGQL